MYPEGQHRTRWPSLSAAFTALNESVTYVVLRNFEHLPTLEFDAHGDIDLLVDDYHRAAAALGAPANYRMPRWGGELRLDVAGRDVVFDLRFVGDRYYDERWARRILRRRKSWRGVLYVPRDDDYLESLAYHAAIHKPAIADDYCRRLAELGRSLGREEWSRPPEQLRELLPTLVRRTVADRGYAFSRPRDVTAFFNYHHAGASHPALHQSVASVRRKTTVLAKHSAELLRRRVRIRRSRAY